MGAWELIPERRLKGAKEPRERFRQSFYGELALILGTAVLVLCWFLPVLVGSAYLIWKIASWAIDAYGPLKGALIAVPYVAAIALAAGAVIAPTL